MRTKFSLLQAKNNEKQLFALIQLCHIYPSFLCSKGRLKKIYMMLRRKAFFEKQAHIRGNGKIPPVEMTNLPGT